MQASATTNSPPIFHSMTINSNAILSAIDKDYAAAPADTVFALRFANGGLADSNLTLRDLRILAQRGQVCARWRGKKILSVELVVPASEALQSLGDVIRHVRGSLESSQASQTTRRASENMPGYFKAHHAAHCSSFAGARSWAGPVDARCV
jgi:hypothetical protein